MLGQYLKIGHVRFFPQPTQFIIEDGIVERTVIMG